VEIGEKYKTENFFKKSVSLKKEITELQRNMLFQRIKEYNKFYKTSFFVCYKKMGEADLYKLEKIDGGISSSIISKIKKIGQQSGLIIDLNYQICLFSHH
jgi:hypothetical protein